MAAVIHGTTLNQITNLNGLHNRTARTLLNDIDPIETVRSVLTATPVFNQIWDYACPVDLKGNRIIDIYPQWERNSRQISGQTFNQNFDVNKNLVNSTPDFTIQWNNQIKYIRINESTLPQGIVVNPCESTDGWKINQGVTALSVDSVNYATGKSSLKANLDSNSTSGEIDLTLSSSLDLSGQINQSSFFIYVYISDSSLLTGQEMFLSWGTGTDLTNNKYLQQVSITSEGTAFQMGWNLVRFDWNQDTEVVGTPDSSDINFFIFSFGYVQGLGINYIVNIDNLVCVMGKYRTIEYYSKYLFSDAATGVFQETVTDNSNLINLDTDSYNLYFNLLAYYAAQQLQGLDAMFYDASFFSGEYEKAKAKYTARQPSQVQKSRQSYYTPQKGGYGKYMGRRFGI